MKYMSQRFLIFDEQIVKLLTLSNEGSMARYFGRLIRRHDKLIAKFTHSLKKVLGRNLYNTAHQKVEEFCSAKFALQTARGLVLCRLLERQLDKRPRYPLPFLQILLLAQDVIQNVLKFNARIYARIGNHFSEKDLVNSPFRLEKLVQLHTFLLIFDNQCWIIKARRQVKMIHLDFGVLRVLDPLPPNILFRPLYLRFFNHARVLGIILVRVQLNHHVLEVDFVAHRVINYEIVVARREEAGKDERLAASWRLLAQVWRHVDTPDIRQIVLADNIVDHFVPAIDHFFEPIVRSYILIALKHRKDGVFDRLHLLPIF